MIDDEYPTLEDLIDCALRGETLEKVAPQKKRENAKQLLEFTKECREQGYGWMIDIHDGRNIDLKKEQDSIKLLQERELLILDYHLASDEPDRSIGILKRLSESEKFNLCVVYSDKPPKDIYQKLVEIFLVRKFQGRLTEEDQKKVRAELEEWEGLTGGLQLIKIIRSEIDGAYQEIWRRDTARIKDIDKLIPQTISGIASLLNRYEKGTAPVNKQQILDHFLGEHEIKKIPSKQQIVRISSQNSPARWVRAGNLFVTIVEKRSEEGSSAAILRTLIEALTDWQPSPARLLLNRFKTELDQRGGGAGDYLMSHKEREAVWLEEILSGGEGERQAKIEKAIARHWEIVFDVVSEKSSAWIASLLLELDAAEDRATWLKEVLGVDIENKGSKRRGLIANNIFACSRRPSGMHLATGHIFRFSGGLWLCLTPACDLVPGQKSGGDLESPLLFRAVKLFARKLEAKPRDNNGSIFLSIDGESCIFDVSEGASQAYECKEFYACRQGRFSQGLKFGIIVPELHSPDFEVRSINHVAEVVAQLRYEYALFYLHALGAGVGRIGLDLIAID